jgi:four helix bundle protein
LQLRTRRKDAEAAVRDVRKYEGFKRADRLVLEVYKLTASFPGSELFGLAAQMRRAAYSIPMNLAEGAARAGAREFAQFINVAVGSCEEVRYQIHLACALGYIRDRAAADLDASYEEVKKMLAGLLRRVAGRSLGSWGASRGL